MQCKIAYKCKIQEINQVPRHRTVVKLSIDMQKGILTMKL